MLAYLDKKDVVKLILHHSNIDLNVRDNSGWTAFAYACNVGYTDIVKLVLNHSTKRNIDLNIRDKHGRTALFQSRNRISPYL